MHANRRRRRPRRSRFKVFLIASEIAILLTIAVILGFTVAAFFSVAKLLPASGGVGNFEPTEATKIYSSDGVVLADIYKENREFVSIEKIPKDLQNATVAIEDKRFYKHLGVDFIGIFRAVYQNFRRGHMAEGGSTLTQQLARNIYLTPAKKLSRKLQEMVLAYEIERNYSKEQILELYLNQIYFGSRAYGVQAASKVYFGKDVKDLTLAECALLAGLPQKPSGYSPYKNLKAAVTRRNVVLKRMSEQHYITPQQCSAAISEPVHLTGQKSTGHAAYKAPWFVYYVLQELADKYQCDEDMIYKGGLRVYTSLNYEMQQSAEESLNRRVREARSRRVTQGALVCIDPLTGQIKAMVGGVTDDFKTNQYNRAVSSRRQPGSSFKAFVYTAAIDNGYDPDYRISNSRISFPMGNGKKWTPRNFDGRYGGTRSIRQAVAMSINIPAVRMAQMLGVDKVITYARMLGIKSPLTSNLSLALGSSGVTPLELCSAYGTFPARGIHAEPMAVVRITTAERSGANENVLLDNKPETRRVLSEQTADTMCELFRGVVTSRGGTGHAAARVPNAHGKTGTTSDDRDAWFVGFTPDLVTAVWVGNDDFGKPMKNVWGGNVCAPAWADFMSKAVKIHEKERAQLATGQAAPLVLPVVSPVSPGNAAKERNRPQETEVARSVTICAESGQLATPQCPTTYDMTLSPGERLGVCTMHGSGAKPITPEEPSTNYEPATTDRNGSDSGAGDYIEVTICVDSGQIANEFCPQTITRRFLASEAPRKVCRMHRPPE
ncbi:MAG TPA: penicillin-binding protein 1A [Armatimonadota bacterium]|jgi:penicillin-binding protein 1A